MLTTTHYVALNSMAPRTLHRSTTAHKTSSAAHASALEHNYLLDRDDLLIAPLTWLDVGTEQLGPVLEQLHLHV